VIRWLRILVCALLIPAYALAAGVVVHGSDPAGLPQMEGAEQPLAADLQGDADELSGLVLELGDTSDDMADHCASAPAISLRAALPDAAAMGPLLQPEGLTLGTLLRPPRMA
jgi:hypothetical protein